MLLFYVLANWWLIPHYGLGGGVKIYFHAHTQTQREIYEK